MLPVSASFRQTNAFAMQYGLVLGLWGFASLALMVQSLHHGALALPALLMFYGSPVFAGYLTVRFRRAVCPVGAAFTFSRAFVFTFIAGIYAAVWIAAGLLAFFTWGDSELVFSAYEDYLSQPELAAQIDGNPLLKDLGSGGGVSGLVDALRAVPAVNYAGLVIYLTFFTAPVFASLIALATRRRAVAQ